MIQFQKMTFIAGLTAFFTFLGENAVATKPTRTSEPGPSVAAQTASQQSPASSVSARKSPDYTAPDIINPAWLAHPAVQLALAEYNSGSTQLISVNVSRVSSLYLKLRIRFKASPMTAELCRFVELDQPGYPASDAVEVARVEPETECD